jgi:Rieske Fe-S protein
MNRRNFLKLSFQSTDPTAPDIPLHMKPSAGYPRDYTRHVPVLVEEARAWVVRDETGFYAVDAVCPHEGGMVRFSDKAFVCPCHGTVFAPDGRPVSGSTHHPLRYLRVGMDGTGKLIVQRDCPVSPDDRFIA